MKKAEIENINFEQLKEALKLQAEILAQIQQATLQLVRVIEEMRKRGGASVSGVEVVSTQAHEDRECAKSHVENVDSAKSHVKHLRSGVKLVYESEDAAKAAIEEARRDPAKFFELVNELVNGRALPPTLVDVFKDQEPSGEEIAEFIKNLEEKRLCPACDGSGIADDGFMCLRCVGSGLESQSAAETSESAAETLKKVSCKHCNGSGDDPDDEGFACLECWGSGHKKKTAEHSNGRLILLKKTDGDLG